MHFQDSRQTMPSDNGILARNLPVDGQMATAAEMMFFNGAPLAHVVAYREHLRLEAICRRNHEFARRMRRLRSGTRGSLLSV